MAANFWRQHVRPLEIADNCHQNTLFHYLPTPKLTAYSVQCDGLHFWIRWWKPPWPQFSLGIIRIQGCCCIANGELVGCSKYIECNEINFILCKYKLNFSFTIHVIQCWEEVTMLLKEFVYSFDLNRRQLGKSYIF